MPLGSGGGIIVGINENMGYDTPFLSYVKNIYIYATFTITLVALAVKSG